LNDSQLICKCEKLKMNRTKKIKNFHLLLQQTMGRSPSKMGFKRP
jgi:hypothetical protein